MHLRRLSNLRTSLVERQIEFTEQVLQAVVRQVFIMKPLVPEHGEVSPFPAEIEHSHASLPSLANISEVSLFKGGEIHT